jgi:ubiquinone/menaquinone biosynthesis C-methylase UbiE
LQLPGNTTIFANWINVRKSKVELYEAVELIQGAFASQKKKTVWADLGCGKGMFTHALARLLREGSQIHAVDQVNETIHSPLNGKTIDFHQLDFTKDVLPFSELDGILMANSFHFVSEKMKLLSRLKRYIRRNGRLLIVEYELNKGNEWVPYPVPIRSMKNLLTNEGFIDIQIIGERKSVYGSHKMYASIATKPD